MSDSLKNASATIVATVIGAFMFFGLLMILGFGESRTGDVSGLHPWAALIGNLFLGYWAFGYLKRNGKTKSPGLIFEIMVLAPTFEVVGSLLVWLASGTSYHTDFGGQAGDYPTFKAWEAFAWVWGTATIGFMVRAVATWVKSAVNRLRRTTTA